MNEVDFESRDWVPDSGWPFGLAELKPYYDRAEELCGIRRGHEQGDLTNVWFGSDDRPVQTHVERFGFARTFTHDMPAMVARQPNVALSTDGTVTALLTDPTGVRITGVRFVNPGGVTRTVEASVVVLAAGGIENARLLLLSRDVHKDGLGNSHDLVGRYFMDHHLLDWGILLPASSGLFESAAIFDLVQSTNGFRMGKLRIAPSVQRSARLLDSSLELTPRLVEEQHQLVGLIRGLIARDGGDTLRALAHLGQNWKSLAALADTGVRLTWHQRRFPGRINQGMWSKLRGSGARFGAFRLLQTIEQGPAPANRVTLIDTRDSLGQRRVRVDCCLDDNDIESILNTRAFLAAHFREKQIGTVLAHEGIHLFNEGGRHHHMGTTRMHVSPRKGVINANAEVHDVRNLFIVGSSVFPTAGSANPTLTILALAIRTADYIAGRLVESHSLPEEVGKPA